MRFNVELEALSPSSNSYDSPMEEYIEFNILIVDDDRSVRELLEDYVNEKKHINVMTADNGDSALELIKRNHFDLIITDLRMPGMSGIDLIRSARYLSPETLAVIMTGYASLETAIQAIREGAYDYITKPFQLDEMDIVIRNAGEKILLMRQNKRLLDEFRRVNGTNNGIVLVK